MTHRRRHLSALTVISITLIGLLSLSGCASSAIHRPTLAALRPIPTAIPTAVAPVESADPATASVPTVTSAPAVTIVPPPTDHASLDDPVATHTLAPLNTTRPSPTTAPALQRGGSADDPDLQSPTSSPWLLAYDSDVEGNDEIYLLSTTDGSAVNITDDPAEDRHPAWSPDGTQIAFQSNRDGNWEIYTLDLNNHRLNRLTYHLAYDGAPSWSPDGDWIVFESYRDTAPCRFGTPVPNPPPCPDLEIYRLPAQGGTPQRLTDSPGGDYQPVWSADGAWIAFSSWRDGDKEIYVMSAEGGVARNVTASEGDDWSPTWSPDSATLTFLSTRDASVELYRQPLAGGPAVRLTVDRLPKERPTWGLDGSLLFARHDPGPPFEAHDPHHPGEQHLYRLSPADRQPQPLLPAVKVRHPAAAPLADLANVPTPAGGTKPYARVIQAGSAPQLELRRMDDIQAPDPRLVAGVDQAFRVWRNAVRTRSGHDFLGHVSDIFRPAAYYRHRLGYLSWHKAGRAVDLLFDWRDSQGENALYIVREDLAGQVYWRLYLKCAVQDGSLGEPLTQAPWYFWWHSAPAGQPELVSDGGRPLPIPPGYYVDVTALAERYGWSRIASYQLDDFHWQRDSTATEYWHYQHTEGMDWYQAMSQILPQGRLQELFSRPIAAARGQTDEVMDGKGLPAADSP